MEPIEKFRRHCADADAILRRTNSTPGILPACRAILDLVEAEPSRRSEFASAFLELLTPARTGPWEILEFCMHQLRWPEVLAAVQAHHDAAAAAHDWRQISVLRSVLDAFTDDWQDSDLWHVDPIGGH